MNTKTSGSDRIYRAYRLALKGARGSRSAHRRQAAREIVTARYKISHRELKEIIRAGDTEAGVTHDHDPHYLEELEFEAAAQKLEASFSEVTGCPVCKNENAKEVKVRAHPFVAEIFEKSEPYYSCFKCYLEVSYDI